MSKVKVDLNKAQIGQLLKSSEMAELLLSEANRICANCGEGYATDTYVASTRVIASVYTESVEAMKDNSDNNTILKAL